MTTSVTFTTRFSDYSTRVVTVPNVDHRGGVLETIAPKVKAFNIASLNGIYVGKDGTSTPTEFESVKIINVNDVIVWTREGGLVE